MKKTKQNKRTAHWLILAVVMCLSVFGFGGVSYAVTGEGLQTEESGKCVTKFCENVESMLRGTGLQKLRTQALKNFGLVVNPYFKWSADFTSNVFREPRVRSEDVIWKFTPGVNMTYTNEYGQLGLSYEADFNYFTKYSEQNEQDQAFSAYAEIHPIDGMRINVSEELRQQGATAGDYSLEPLNFTDNTVTTSAAYDISEVITGEIGWQNFSREYAGDIFDRYSYIENKLTFRGYYQFNEDTRLHSGYEFGLVDYDEGNNSPGQWYAMDASYHEFPVGIETKLPFDVYAAGKVGAYFRTQDAAELNDFWAFVGSASLKKQITQKTATEVGFLRRPVEATYGNIPIYDEKLWYVNTTHALRPNVRGRMDMSYANRDFEDVSTVGRVVSQRDDSVYSVGVGMDYALCRWMIMNLDYRYELRNSNISDFDCTENRLSLGMTIPM